MADSSENSGSSTIKITVKTPKEKHEIEINGDNGIKELKDEVSKKFSCPIEQVCLIFAGKILKDGESLTQHGIKDGLVVHLVIKSANRTMASSPSSSSPSTAPGSAAPQADVGATPFGLGGLGGLAGLGNLGMGSANFMEMQQRMQREMMGNPEMMRQMMDNPFVQQMMSNPDVMRQLLMNNPQMRELMERNPEITHMLNNPELMRQTMELARNPSMLQELMRTQDRAMSNLESIPGGFNALQRMYRDVQEPMMNAAQEGFGSNPFASLVNQDGTSNNSDDSQRGRENTAPLPNPWAPAGSAGSTATTTTNTTPSNTSTPPAGSFTPQTGGPFGMFNTPGMQSLMTQMQQNPQMMQNMLQAPYMQSMLQTMSANPQLAQQVLGSNPMFASNPQLQEHFQQYMPTLVQQMQNPDMQAMLTNPRAMQAMMQIQQGMQTLATEAPGIAPGALGMPAASTTSATPSTTTASATSPAPATSPTSPASPPTDTTATTTTTTTNPTPTASTAPTPAGDQFNTMMAQMMQMMVAGQINQVPEQRYASQLEQLATMGFVDRDANIRALTATLGDVNAAIDRLLQQR